MTKSLIYSYILSFGVAVGSIVHYNNSILMDRKIEAADIKFSASQKEANLINESFIKKVNSILGNNDAHMINIDTSNKGHVYSIKIRTQLPDNLTQLDSLNKEDGNVNLHYLSHIDINNIVKQVGKIQGNISNSSVSVVVGYPKTIKNTDIFRDIVNGLVYYNYNKIKLEPIPPVKPKIKNSALYYVHKYPNVDYISIDLPDDN